MPDEEYGDNPVLANEYNNKLAIHTKILKN